MPYACHKLAVDWTYALIRALRLDRHSTVSCVLGERGNSEIGLAVVQRIAVDVVGRISAFVWKSKDESGHRVFARILATNSDRTRRIETPRIILGCVPFMDHDSFVVFDIYNRPLSLRKWYEPVRLFLGCHARFAVAGRLARRFQRLTLPLYQRGVL